MLVGKIKREKKQGKCSDNHLCCSSKGLGQYLSGKFYRVFHININLLT